MGLSFLRLTTGVTIVLVVAAGAAFVQGLHAQAAPRFMSSLRLATSLTLKASRLSPPNPARRRWPLSAAGT